MMKMILICSEFRRQLTLRDQLEKSNLVKEVSIDMANNMEKAARESFPDASIVTDRFHVAKLVNDAVQDIQVGNRWIAIEEESEDIKKAKDQEIDYVEKFYSNGETKKQLLARSRYFLFKYYLMPMGEERIFFNISNLRVVAESRMILFERNYY